MEAPQQPPVDHGELIAALRDRLTLLEGKTLAAVAADPVPEPGQEIEEEPDTTPYPVRPVLDCRKVSLVPHRRNNPVARPITASPRPALFDLENERGYQAIKNLRSTATQFEYKWTATGVSYLFDSLSELRQQCARPDLTEGARTSFATIERHFKLGLDILVNRLDFLKLIALLGTTDPGLIKYAEERLVGTSGLPLHAPNLLAVVKEYRDRRTVEVLKAVGNRAAKDVAQPQQESGMRIGNAGPSSGGPITRGAARRARERGSGRSAPAGLGGAAEGTP